ncbi:MAG: ABC transporter substrate-binding protein [Thermoplasmatota archaeon]
MEASKEGEMPSEPAPETLPTEIKEEGPKKTKLLAVIIVVIVVIAAIAAAFGLGLIGGKKEETNLAPTAGARALTSTTIPIGGTVKFESLATDPDGTIAKYWWYFGDGTNVSGDAAAAKNVSHTYAYGGHYWVYHIATDDKGLNGSNEAAMVGVDVLLYIIPPDPTNTTAPFAFLTSNVDVIDQNTTVNFNMTSSAGVNYTVADDLWEEGYDRLTGTTLDYGVGTAAVSVAPAEYMTESHKYTQSGHFAAKFVATAWNENSTTVMRTIHVLTPKATFTGVIKNPNAFIMVTIGEPDYLDPAVDYETAGGEVLQNCYESLVWYSGTSASTLVPQLATKVPTVGDGITADGLYYNFTLRTGVKFHNNQTMTADDVVYSVQRVVRIHDPDGPAWMVEQVLTDGMSAYIGDTRVNWTDSVTTHTIPAWLLATVGGTDPYYIITELDNQNASEAAVKAIDPTHVSFRLTHAYPAFLYICAYTVMDVVSKVFVEANGGVSNGNHNDVMDVKVCGTGPYYMEKWEKGVKIHLVRWDSWWNSANQSVKLQDVYIVKANDQNTRILMLQAGDADCAVIPMDFESLFSDTSKFTVKKGLPTFDITFAGFNMNINTTAAALYGSTVPADFFTDIHVRSAFVHLLNYTQFITNVLKGNAIQPNGPIPKGMFGYDPSVPVYDYNLTAAQTELTAAINPATGNSWWFDGFTIAFMFNSGNAYREAACTYMKSALESMGSQFHATINALDWPTYLANLRKAPSPFPLFYLGWAPDYADPDNYCNPFLLTGGTFAYRTQYSNATIDALVKSASSELNLTLRAQMYSEITWLTHNDTPYIWLYQSNNFHVERSWIKGYYYNPMYSGFYYPSFSKG